MVWQDPSGNRLTGKSHVAGESEGEAGTLPIEGVSLDGFVASLGHPEVRLIKIDIEGAELPALRGATQLLEASRPILFCELWDEYCRRYGHRAADLIRFLTERGYRIYEVNKDKAITPTTATDYCGAADILALPEDEKRQPVAPSRSAG